MSHSNKLDNGVIVISNSDESGEVEFHFNDGRVSVYRWEALRHGLRAKEVTPAKPCEMNHLDPYNTPTAFGRCVKCGATVEAE